MSMALYIGIDLGGTKIAGAIYDAETNALIASKTIPTEAHEGADAVIARIAAHVRDLCASAEIPLDHIAGLAVGVPASFDSEKGEILVIPNLPGQWMHKPILPMLRGMLGIPCSLINDARAFTLGEALLGAGRGASSVVGITLGTGIGGGVVINGRLYLGLTGSAGEFGHMCIDMYGLPDGTGNPGGWESFASGPAIAAMGMKYVAQGVTTQIGERVGFDLNKITPEVIRDCAEAGDAIAIEILAKAGFYLGTGLSNIITLFAPERVVIGGGMSALGEWIFAPMRAEVVKRVHTVPLDQCRILLAELGGNAGVIGAAIWASQQG
jgi:glucokinase